MNDIDKMLMDMEVKREMRDDQISAWKHHWPLVIMMMVVAVSAIVSANRFIIACLGLMGLFTVAGIITMFGLRDRP